MHVFLNLIRKVQLHFIFDSYHIPILLYILYTFIATYSLLRSLSPLYT